MKKIIILVFLAVLSLLIFSACTLFKANEPVDVAALCNQMSPDTILDSRIFEAAVRKQSSDKCAEIINPTKKLECIQTINALKLTSDAVRKADKKKCKNIELDRYKENCLTEVADKIKEDKAEEEFNKVISDQYTLAAELTQKGDLDGCEKLKDENIRSQCKVNILLNRAATNKDKSACITLEDIDKNMVEECQSLL